MKKTLRTAAFLAATIVSLSAAAQDEAPLISNYGYTNLTYGYGQPDCQGTMSHREEVLVDGVMHVMWVQDGGLEDGWRRLHEVWYRRSDDLGKTWSKPVCVADRCENVSDGDKMLNVVGETVHIVARNSNQQLCYYRSVKGGDFTCKELMVGDRTASEFRSVVVGKQVAIAYYYYAYTDVYCFYSDDNGENFTEHDVIKDDTHYANVVTLKDFAFDGNRMALLYEMNGAVYVFHSEDKGRHWEYPCLSPSFKDEEGNTVYHGGAFDWWRNGSDVDHPVPQLVIDGDKIYALFHTRLTADDEKESVVLARSLDGGKTWLPLTKITDDFFNYNGNLVVRGDNVYVTFNNTDCQKRGVYHSHDGGATFELQNSWAFALNGQFNFYANNGEIYVDDNDPTGQTAYFLFNDYGYVKTIDGFRTVCEVNSNGNRYTSERYTHLLVDREGRRHWFLEHQLDDNSYNRYINYRREGDDPQSSWADYALHLASNPDGDWGHMNYISVHNTWETMPDREMTVEYWLKTGGYESKDIARVWDGGYGGYEAWSTSLWQSDWYDKHAFVVKLCNYAERSAELVSTNVEPNTWCHVAFTYSESAREARLYVNGQLTDTQPMDGSLRWGRLPIVIGGGNPSSDLLIDDFRLWNRPLSAGEIADNYAAKAAGKSFTGARGLMLNYTFNRTLHDMSSHGHHAIPVGQIEFEGFDPTGIQSVTTDAAAQSRTYDLQGRPEAGNHNGVVITNGRKEFVK